MDKTLSNLFREIESETGTHGFCIMALGAIKEALLEYHIKSREELKKHLTELFELLASTKPRYAILLDSFYKIMERVDSAPIKEPINYLIKEIDRIGASYQLEKREMVQHATDIDLDGKAILIYDHSHSVQDVLLSAKQKGQQFRLMVAEQDLEKTEDNIEFCHQNEIAYQVVPSYMLSHIDEQIDYVFMGAVTFQENHQFVMDPGCKSIISHFHLEKKPIYLFITTSKFSLWPLTDKSHEVYAKPHRRKHHQRSDIEFERLKFSHDRVSIDLVQKIITEKGIYTPRELLKLFDDMFKKRAEKRRKYLKK